MGFKFIFIFFLVVIGLSTSCTSPTNSTLLHSSSFELTTNPWLQSKGIEVDLPVNGSSCGVVPIRVFIDKDNQYYIEDTLYSNIIELEQGLMSCFDSSESGKSINLYADKDAKWGYCVGIIDLARKNDIVISVRSK